MRDGPRLSYADLARVYVPSGNAEELVGLEMECGLVDPRTGRSVDYDSAAAVVDAVVKELGGEPVTEAGWLVGGRLASGAHVSLELGCAIEYASTPFRSLAELVRVTRRDVAAIAEIARPLKVAVLPGGLLPFTPVTQIPWLPKPRVAIMRRYFGRLGAAGSCAEGVMGLSLSTQTTLDYLSEMDLVEKLTMLVKAAPIAAAMFVNSPLQDAAPAPALSRRMQMWRRVDPSRCGVLGVVTEPGFTPSRLVDWAAGLPMIYRGTPGGQLPAPDRSFAELIRYGFGDGTMPAYADWVSHLSQIWPHVRPRRTLELRAFDGLGWWAFAAAPAFWVGLTYHAPSRRDALALLDGITGAELDQATEDIAVRGLDAMVGHRPVGALAGNLLDLARQGLQARARQNLDPPDVVDLLDPLAEVVTSGVTHAERCLRDWCGPLHQSPAALVSAYRI